MEDLTETQICNEVDCPENKSFPSSHPFAYSHGEYCCQTNKEYGNTAHGYKCDGSSIDFNSLCYENHQLLQCPFDTCHNHDSALGEYYEGHILQLQKSAVKILVLILFVKPSASFIVKIYNALVIS